MSDYPSKSKMRRDVMEDGIYYSDSMGQWCRVNPRYGAEYFSSLEDAYDAIGTEHEGAADDRQLREQAGWSPR